MQNDQWKEIGDTEHVLSMEKAEEILRNVFQAVNITPPANIHAILLRERRAGYGKDNRDCEICRAIQQTSD